MKSFRTFIQDFSQNHLEDKSVYMIYRNMPGCRKQLYTFKSSRYSQKYPKDGLKFVGIISIMACWKYLELQTYVVPY